MYAKTKYLESQEKKKKTQFQTNMTEFDDMNVYDVIYVSERTNKNSKIQTIENWNWMTLGNVYGDSGKP